MDNTLAEYDEKELLEMLKIEEYIRLLAQLNPNTGKQYTQAQALEKLGYGSYAVVVKWKEQGLIEATMRVLLGQLSVGFQAITATVWQEWAAIVARQVDVALHGGAKDSLFAAKWLSDTFIAPGLAASVDPGSEELAYVASSPSLNPLLPMQQINITVNAPSPGDEPVIIDGDD